MQSNDLTPLLVANQVILVGILAVMLSVYAHAVINGEPSVLLYSRNPSAASCFWFYFAGMLCVLILYFALDSNNLTQTITHFLFDVFGDLGSLCTLGAAWAYSRGTKFSLASTLLTLGLAEGFLVIWYLAWQAPFTRTLFLDLLQVAPGIALSVVSTVVLGWVFFVRWGGLIGGIYLIIRVGYGLLQLPANLAVDVRTYFKDDAAASLSSSFAWLAGGKVLMAIAFLVLLIRSDLPDIDITEQRTVPKETFRLSDPMRDRLLLDLGLAFVMAILAALLIEDAEKVYEFICGHVPLCFWRP
jgi:hypothetical protein